MSAAAANVTDGGQTLAAVRAAAQSLRDTAIPLVENLRAAAVEATIAAKIDGRPLPSRQLDAAGVALISGEIVPSKFRRLREQNPRIAAALATLAAAASVPLPASPGTVAEVARIASRFSAYAAYASTPLSLSASAVAAAVAEAAHGGTRLFCPMLEEILCLCGYQRQEVPVAAVGNSSGSVGSGAEQATEGVWTIHVPETSGQSSTQLFVLPPADTLSALAEWLGALVDAFADATAPRGADDADLLAMAAARGRPRPAPAPKPTPTAVTASASPASAAEDATNAGGAGAEAEDFASVRHLIPTVERTLHNTGRLRNAAFGALHFTLRRMTHGRCSYVCADDRCLRRGPYAVGKEVPAGEGGANGGDGASGPLEDCLEAHWHARSSNLLYAYTCHLSPCGTRVLHLGDEYGYQYNSLPGTAHFQRTVLTSIKSVNMHTHVIEKIAHPNRPVDGCVGCGQPFTQLWL